MIRVGSVSKSAPPLRAVDRDATFAMRVASRSCVLVLIALVGACAAPPPKPTEIDGIVTAAANVNPSVSKRPSPLLVRIYELKTPAAFSNADFVTLYERDQAELGAEMVTRDEFMLNPGDTRPWVKVAAPETRFIGVLAAYRDLDRARWRSIVALQPHMKQRIVITAEELTITAKVAK